MVKYHENNGENMIENIEIEKLRQEAVSDIKKKIRNNSKFLHPCNKEKLEYQRKLKFENGYDFTVWMQQNGIMKNPANIYRKQKEKTATNAGFNVVRSPPPSGGGLP
jgi:hypothetical protein